MTTSSTGLSERDRPRRPRGGWRPPTSSAPATTGGTKSTMTASTRDRRAPAGARPRTWRRSRSREGRRGCPRRPPPAATPPAPRACRRPARAARAPPPRRRRRRGSPRPPALVTHRHLPPRRQRLRGQQRGDVEQLAERVGPDDAGLLEQRVDRLLGARQRARCASPPPGCPRGCGRSSWPGSACVRATRRAMRPKRRGLPNDSRYSRTSSVAGSSSQYSSRSLEDTSALLPIETNADRPSPRAVASWRKASPSAPLCDENPMLPAGMKGGPKVAFSRGPDTAIPRQLGPISRPPCARTSVEQPLLALGARGPGLGEAGRDDAQRAHARVAAPPRRPRAPRSRRHRDDREVDRVREVGDRRVGAHARDRRRVGIDRMGGAREVAGDDVAEQLAADRPAPRRGADHRDAAGAKKAASEAVTATWSRRSTRSK